jgi:hypothetical protein
MIVLKINKRFGSSHNKVSSDIDSNTANNFIEYLEARAILCKQFSGGDRAKYTLYIEIIAFSITIAHDKSPHLRSGNCKKIDRKCYLNSIQS